jgi:hypothetical protein
VFTHVQIIVIISVLVIAAVLAVTGLVLVAWPRKKPVLTPEPEVPSVFGKPVKYADLAPDKLDEEWENRPVDDGTIILQPQEAGAFAFTVNIPVELSPGIDERHVTDTGELVMSPEEFETEWHRSKRPDLYSDDWFDVQLTDLENWSKQMKADRYSFMASITTDVFDVDWQLAA